MFNLKKHSSGINPTDLLQAELNFMDIYASGSQCRMLLGDEEVLTNSLHDCTVHVDQAIKELKSHIWNAWSQLSDLARLIPESNSGNRGDLDNLLFLNSVQKSFRLSKQFTDLAHIEKELRALFNIDVAEVTEGLLVQFNHKYLEIRLIHQLIMSEIYRRKVIKQYMKVTKHAQISGPWANLDLPMKERVWEYEEDEEYFYERQKSRREQTRYNPETNKQGFYFVWQDLTRDPYKFEDMGKDSPYKSRTLMTIP